jgi:hypothetical protein
MHLFAFFTSLDGWKGNVYFQYFLVEFVLGLFVFFYSIIYIIKNKKFNYFILTPITLIMFCIFGMYYGEYDELKINSIEHKIERFYEENGNYDDKEKLFKYINALKNMKITINENKEIIIEYKNMMKYKNDK